MQNPTFSVVLPCFNENENIKIFIPQLTEGFKDFEIEIIFIDDGSTDGTLETIENFQKTLPFIKIIRRDRLMGLGSALKAGYRAASGRYVVSFDCDLAVSIEDARRIADKLLDNEFDLVLGSRYLIGSFYEALTAKSRKKKAVSQYANIFLRFTNFIPVSDFTFNCRGIKRGVWEKIKPESDNNFMLFEMIWRASRLGLQITEVPVRFFDRKLGSSKLKLESEAIKYLIQLFKMRWREILKKFGRDYL